MKILVNGISLMGVLTGIARYVRSLYSVIEQESWSEVHYFNGKGISSRQMPDQAGMSASVLKSWLAKTLPVSLSVSLRSLLLRKNELRLRKAIAHQEFDIYHETTYFPCLVDQRLKTVITIHDLSLLKYPEYHPDERVAYVNKYLHKRLSEANHILAVSDFTRREIIKELAIPEKKISVVHEAANAVFYRRSAEEVEKLLLRYGLPRHYMLYVGTMEPRKNLLQVVRAMSLFPDNLRKHLPLVCVGWRGWKNEELMVEIKRLGVAADFFFLGRVADNNLAKLYSGARVFLYPSLYEGFGLPILEAMACGCPVICSNQASLPEVAGDAAVFVAPEDHELLAYKIENTIENEDFRQYLVESGYQRAAKFSWEKTAGKTIEVFRQLINA